MNKRIFIVFAIFLTSCSSPAKQDTLLDFYTAQSGKSAQEFANFNYIIVINELGTCINCNNIFSKTMAKKLDDDKVLFILSGQGTKVDISAYIDAKHENVIWDYEGAFNELEIVKKCAILNLDKGKIVSIKEITPKNVSKDHLELKQI